MLVDEVVLGGAIFAVLCWLVHRAMQPLVRRVDNSAWWRKRYGYRHSFGDFTVAIVFLLPLAGLLIAAALR